MDDAIAWIVGIAIIIFIGGVWCFIQGLRTKGMRAACQAAGYRFTEDDLGSEDIEILALFRTGRDNEVRNVWQGEAHGVPLRLFDFEYTSGRGRNMKMITQTVVGLAVNGYLLPRFYARPRSILDSIGAALGGMDVVVPDAKRLHKRYRIRGDDENAIRRIFTDAAGKWLGERKGWAVEGEGAWLLVYRPGKTVKPAAATGLIDDALELFESLLPTSQ